METPMSDMVHDTAFGGRAQGARTGLFARIRTAAALWHQRRALLEMGPHQLRDIGISPDEALAEARRPIWDVPPAWRL
jgi:uncharacterized protein YjiS (DUF1127 family)